MLMCCGELADAGGAYVIAVPSWLVQVLQLVSQHHWVQRMAALPSKAGGVAEGQFGELAI